MIDKALQSYLNDMATEIASLNKLTNEIKGSSTFYKGQIMALQGSFSSLVMLLGANGYTVSLNPVTNLVTVSREPELG